MELEAHHVRNKYRHTHTDTRQLLGAMAAAETLTTADVIRQGVSQEVYDPSGKEKSVVERTQKKLEEMEFGKWSEYDLLRLLRQLGPNVSVEALIEHVTSRTYSE